MTAQELDLLAKEIAQPRLDLIPPIESLMAEYQAEAEECYQDKERSTTLLALICALGQHAFGRQAWTTAQQRYHAARGRASPAINLEDLFS